MNNLEKKKIQNRVLSGDAGISAAPRLAEAHPAAETNAPSGHLNQTPGEGACVSHVPVCAVLRPPAPSKASHNLCVPAKDQADWAAAWAHGQQAPGHPVATSHRPSVRWPAPHLVYLSARRRACPFHKLSLFSSTLPRRAPGSAHGPAGTSPPHDSLT